jgi:hypothetical protein
MSEVYVFDIAWHEIAEWFIVQPVYAQILVLIGVFAVLTLAVIIVYYVLKGVAYLIYYLLKGIYYLLKGIGLLFYKIFEALYYAISGKPKPMKDSAPEQQTPPQQQVVYVVKQEQEPIVPVQQSEQIVTPEIAYCSECGNKFSDTMLNTLQERGIAYCIHCGNKKTQEYQMSIESQ